MTLRGLQRLVMILGGKVAADFRVIVLGVAAQYREQHGEPPSKHRQWVDGAEREVNSYTERDRRMVERAILAHTRN